MRLAILTSGGKDSLFACYIMASQGFDIKYLLSVVPETKESYMFHRPSVALSRLQSEALGVELLTKGTKGEKEKELKDLKDLISSVKGEIEGVVAGAVASEYQRQRVDVICEDLGLRSFAPIWHKEPELLLREMTSANFEIIITSVTAQGLDESWLGRKIDEKCIEDLISLNKKYGIHVSGEGGEYETLVLDMPMFKRRLEVLKARKEWDGTSGTYIVEKARLSDKS